MRSLLGAVLTVWLAGLFACQDSTGPSAPAAPSGLAANVVSSSQIDLTWTDNAGSEQGFRIERCEGAVCAAFVEVGTVTANVIAYQSKGLAAGTSYTYRVRAYNAAGSSPFAGPATATTQVIVPAAPSGLSATAISSSQIDLSWTDNADNEAGFRIERCEGAGCSGFAEVGTAAANLTSYQSAGLKAGTSYSYRVRAYNAAGSSAYTDAAAARTQEVVPAGPAGLTAAVVSSSQIDLTWTDNADNEEGFRIERCGGAGCSLFAEVGTVAANVTGYQGTGLAAGTSYSYRVRAYNAAGNSGYSNVASATTTRQVVRYAAYAAADNVLLINSADASAANTPYPGGALYLGCLFFVGLVSNFACYEMALRFDVLSVIQGNAVQRAVLRLYPRDLALDMSTTYRMCAFAGAWSASTVTFNNKPGCYSFGAHDKTPPPTLDPLEYDVTDIVQRWADGTWANNGFFLFPTDAVFPSYTTTRITEFESMNVYSSLVRRPQLYIEYQ